MFDSKKKKLNKTKSADTLVSSLKIQKTECMFFFVCLRYTKSKKFLLRTLHEILD